MSIIINYFIEANLALWFFIALYFFILRRSTDFTNVRMIMMIGIAASVTFPLIHWKVASSPLGNVQNLMPTIILPELQFGAPGASNPSMMNWGVIQWAVLAYIIGFTFYLMLTVHQFIKLFIHLKGIDFKKHEGLLIGQSTSPAVSFSFFRFVCLGQFEDLSESEKRKIMAHERVHASRYHSIDILILAVLGVCFWFNPAVRIYKNILVQLHEFEADARAVESDEVDEYCSLLARVALLSADLRIASHFSNSLTLKRIQMMRKIKSRIKPWRMALIAGSLPLLFVIISCQEQVVTEVTDLAKASTVALDVPADVQRQYDELRATNPKLQLLLVEVGPTGKPKLQSLQEKLETLSAESIAGVHVIKHPAKSPSEFERSFIIVQFDDNLRKVQEASKTEGNVYTVVDQTAEPDGGMPKFYEFMQQNLIYPTKVREKGVEGKVFVSFIVEVDGSISDVSVTKGVDPDLDAEAIRVIKASPKWIAAKNNGVPVRQRLVLPMNFSLGT
jgi:TonB family protein